jgi:hypothetical protein
MKPIDTSQLNNSNRKTWHWSIRYGIDQLNNTIDQSLVLMVTMKHFDHAVFIAALRVCHPRCFPSFTFKSLSLRNNSPAINVALLQISRKLSRCLSISACDCGLGAGGVEFSGPALVRSFTRTACRSPVASSSSSLTFNEWPLGRFVELHTARQHFRSEIDELADGSCDRQCR